MPDSDETDATDDGWSPSEEELRGILEKHKEWLESDGERGERANLTGANLSEAHLNGVNLSEALLERVDLSGAELPEADLSEAYLREANLSGVNLSGADLLEAKLWDTDLSEASLVGVDLSEASLSDADLSGSSLSHADLSGAGLSHADLSEAYLYGVDLSGASLSDADLPGTNLYDADLSEATVHDANLSEAHLNGVNLSEAKLWETDLSGASLQDANLWSSNVVDVSLDGSDLQDATLWGADLTGAALVEADLQNADLGGTDGLQAGAVARANTSNATLPSDVAEFDGLKTVEEASRGARRIFISLGLACAYSALAIWSVDPESAGEETLTLPFIDVDIGLWDFHLVVPVLLAVGFGYLHLHLQRVWEEISRLPAIFPDGKAVDQKIHPWLITGFVRGHFPYIRENPIPLFRLQEYIVIMLAWGTVPATQIYFVGSFVMRFPEYTYNSWVGAALVALTTMGAVVSYQTAKAHLRGEYEGLFRPFGDEEDDSIRKNPNWHTVFLSVEWTLAIFALWIGWTFVW